VKADQPGHPESLTKGKDAHMVPSHDEFTESRQARVSLGEAKNLSRRLIPLASDIQ